MKDINSARGDWMKAIVNANIITNDEVLKDYGVIFEDRILKIEKSNDIDTSIMEEVIDAENKYLSPGLIDIHIHGCMGNDTMDDNDCSIADISRALPAAGVTAFLPTTMAMEFSLIRKTLNRIRSLMNNAPGAEILGCNLEGPFINADYRGAHEIKHIIEPDFNKIREFSDVIRIVTFAPEEKGSEEFIENCARYGVKAAIGHTKANYRQAMRAIQKGANHVTHMFNAMTPLHHREPGVVGAAMDSAVSCELISDNVHVSPAAQRILLKAKGIDRIILITDAMRACLLRDGKYELGGQRVLVKGGEARLPGGRLAGSVLTLNKALKNFACNTGVNLTDAVRTVTENPARLLMISDRKGSICIGKDADLTLFDRDFNVHVTYVKGKKAYSL